MKYKFDKAKNKFIGMLPLSVFEILKKTDSNPIEFYSKDYLKCFMFEDNFIFYYSLITVPAYRLAKIYKDITAKEVEIDVKVINKKALKGFENLYLGLDDTQALKRVTVTIQDDCNKMEIEGVEKAGTRYNFVLDVESTNPGSFVINGFYFKDGLERFTAFRLRDKSIEFYNPEDDLSYVVALLV